MRTTDQQVRRLLMEYQKHGTVKKAAMLADMTPKTAKKYIESGQLPSSQKKQARDWRTRKDPFEGVWEAVEVRLENAPELEGKALFEWLCEAYPGQFQEGQLRSFQRRVKTWRATKGPDKEVYFPQEHPPGKRLSFDFTFMDKLGITIAGEAFPHKLFHAVLSYSNWQWVHICHSESLLALRSGLQSTFLQLGHLPKEVWSDHSSAATHEVGKTDPGTRKFNAHYLELVEHYGVTPRTIQVNHPNENGDVESANGALKSRVRQHLLLRGSSDFESVDEYRLFLEKIVHKANRTRSAKFKQELSKMRPVTQSLLNEYDESVVRVTRNSTVTVRRKTFSVPSRLIGEKVKVRLYEDAFEIWYNGERQDRGPRHPGREHQISYRHVIDWLLRKPGAFNEYRYKEDLFPDIRFKNAYEKLCSVLSRRRADIEYLQILKYATDTSESDVLEALESLGELDLLPTYAHVMEFIPAREASIPAMPPYDVRLDSYNDLLSGDANEA